MVKQTKDKKSKGLSAGLVGESAKAPTHGAAESAQNQLDARRVISGVVVSNKMQKTIVVAAERNVRLFVAFRILFNARFYYPVFMVMFLDFGITVEEFALLNAIWAAAIVILEVPSGALADLVGRRSLRGGHDGPRARRRRDGLGRRDGVRGERDRALPDEAVGQEPDGRRERDLLGTQLHRVSRFAG